MSHYEAAPPAAAWTNIAARLEDDRQFAAVSDRMNAYEQMPPPFAWENIARSLDADNKPESDTPVIRFQSSLVRRLAVAAMVLIIAGAGWWWLTRTNGAAPSFVQQDPTPASTNPAKDANIPQATKDAGSNSSAISKETPALAFAAGGDQNSRRAKSERDEDVGAHVLSYAAVERLPSFPESPVVISGKPLTDENGNLIRDIDVLTTNSNYLTVMGPNGQLTRISAKFASVIRYLNEPGDTEEYLDRVIRESDTWKKRFQEWRSKIIQSSYVPAASNFFDIAAFGELVGDQP
jgi:hypothetical protein